MDYLLQKVAYLKGLAEGLGVAESSKEGKVLVQIIEVLESFTNVLDDLIEDQMDLEEYVNFIDEDLADVEEDIYGEDDDDDDYDFDDDDDWDEDYGYGVNPEYDFDEEFDDCCGDPGCSCGNAPEEE